MKHEDLIIALDFYKCKSKDEYIEDINKLRNKVKHYDDIMIGMIFDHYLIDVNTYDRVGVVGSRTFKDYELLKNTLDKYRIGAIVSGHAVGADSLSERYAKENKIPTLIFKPEWNKNGRYNPSAGFDRNTTIVVESDMIIAFWDGVSNGTKDSIRKANNRGIEVVIINF